MTVSNSIASSRHRLQPLRVMPNRVAVVRFLVCLLLAAWLMLPAESASERWDRPSPAVPCGVDAAAAMARILGETVEETAIAEAAADYRAPASMSLLDVAHEFQLLTDREPTAYEASFDELLWLDRPLLMHLAESGCSSCGGEGHVVAVERLTADWAIVVHTDRTELVGALELRKEYAGHALLPRPPAGAGDAPAIACDSYVAELGNILAGERRPCRVAVRNVGRATLNISRIDSSDSVACSHAPAELGPGEVDWLDLIVCPSHRFDRAFDTRTFFVHIHSNDSVRPRTTVALRCTVVEPVIPETPIVYFPRVSRSNPSSRTISLECRPPAKLLGAAASQPAVAVAVEQTGETLSSTRYALHITVQGDRLEPGIIQVPIALQLDGVASRGAELIARVRVSPD